MIPEMNFADIFKFIPEMKLRMRITVIPYMKYLPIR